MPVGEHAEARSHATAEPKVKPEEPSCNHADATRMIEGMAEATSKPIKIDDTISSNMGGYGIEIGNEP
ncbi:hypothetical protein C8J31_11489 [Rhizobium sp. PP-CC-2G-626]|nr:hypothetical protein C8J31_11489 [Rhizobium sp. PP-CC-2G-626]